MKTIATIAASLALSLGLLVAPAHAEDAAPADCPAAIESQGREVLLGYTIVALKETVETMNTDLVQAERKIQRKQATIDRLRAKLARR